VCNPDFKLLVALSVPRSAFLAYFQPAGASRRPKRGNAKIHKKDNLIREWEIGFSICTCGFLECLEKVVSKALPTKVERALETW
jgi:hypothetical protein